MPNKICKVEGCNKSADYKDDGHLGYCNSHYRKYKKYGDPTVSRKKVREVCSVPNCGKPHEGNGFCMKHNRRFKLYGDPLGECRKPKKQCSIKGCKRPYYAKGFCQLHYDRDRVNNGAIQCKVKGCTRPGTKGHGFCGLHYQRWKKYGDAEYTKVHRHGGKRTLEYQSWLAMKQRCYNKKHTHYKDYGGRGITVCDRWLDKLNGFENFLEDMGHRPSKEYSLDRIDNDKGYYKENCRWATKKEQANNRRGRKPKNL